MRRKTGMAATFTQITLDEMDKFLRRAFRALEPDKTLYRGEVAYNLTLGHDVGIKVLTSIGKNGETAAGVGADAIRVQLFNFKRDKPLAPGKFPIVKRTQGWRDNLKDRIEDLMEKFYDKEEDILAGRFINWA